MCHKHSIFEISISKESRIARHTKPNELHTICKLLFEKYFYRPANPVIWRGKKTNKTHLGLCFDLVIHNFSFCSLFRLMNLLWMTFKCMFSKTNKSIFLGWIHCEKTRQVQGYFCQFFRSYSPLFPLEGFLFNLRSWQYQIIYWRNKKYHYTVNDMSLYIMKLHAVFHYFHWFADFFSLPNWLQLNEVSFNQHIEINCMKLENRNLVFILWEGF